MPIRPSPLRCWLLDAQEQQLITTLKYNPPGEFRSEHPCISSRGIKFWHNTPTNGRTNHFTNHNVHRRLLSLLEKNLKRVSFFFFFDTMTSCPVPTCTLCGQIASQYDHVDRERAACPTTAYKPSKNHQKTIGQERSLLYTDIPLIWGNDAYNNPIHAGSNHLWLKTSFQYCIITLCGNNVVHVVVRCTVAGGEDGRSADGSVLMLLYCHDELLFFSTSLSSSMLLLSCPLKNHTYGMHCFLSVRIGLSLLSSLAIGGIFLPLLPIRMDWNSQSHSYRIPACPICFEIFLGQKCACMHP